MPEEIQLREKGRKQASLTPAFFLERRTNPRRDLAKENPP